MTTSSQNVSIRLAGWLMIISAAVHVLQLPLVGVQNPENINGALFGSTFVVVGWLLLTRPHIGLWVGIFWPGLLGAGALYRIIMLTPTPMTYVFALMDVIVVGICLFHLVFGKSPRHA
ncbi:MAG: hypothetical protein ACON4J_02205 [Parvibaculales bacterium]